MSVVSPTLLPRSPNFPVLLPKPPQPHLVPLPKWGQPHARFSLVRDLAREMEELDEEEDELTDLKDDVKNRGFTFLIPIGRSVTQQEEKNDASDVSEDEGTDASASVETDLSEHLDDSNEDDEDEVDLDADMEDMDDGDIGEEEDEEGEEGNLTTDTAPSDDMEAEISGEYEESSIDL